MVPATCFEGSKTVRGNLALTSGVIVNREKCPNLINRKRRLCRVLEGTEYLSRSSGKPWGGDRITGLSCRAIIARGCSVDVACLVLRLGG